MNTSTISSIIILSMLFAILSSLGFGLFYLLSTKHKAKTATSLTIRVSLSVLLFAGLILAIWQGWIVPNPKPL